MLVKRLFLSALLVFVALYVAACGGSSHPGGGGSQNPLAINATSLPTGYVGSNYPSTTLTASGGSGRGYAWLVTSLPAGMALSSDGVLTGTPTTAGSTSFPVTVTDSERATLTTTLTLTVKPGVSITTAAGLPDAFVGVDYSQTLAVTGGTGSGYTWTVSGGSTLPRGLTLSTAGVLAGKPTAAATATFNITVTDSAQNTATAQFSANIKSSIAVATPPALPTAYVGSFYSLQLVATGGSGTYTWSLARAAAVRSNTRHMTPGGLPDGLSLSSDGWITGTPTQTGTAVAMVIVTDSSGNSGSMDVSFTISAGVTITTPATLPGGNQGDLYSQRLAASGGTGTGYTWTPSDGTLPGGLRLSPDGVLSGSLPAVNTYSFGVTVTDSAENTASVTFTLTVTNSLRFTTPPTLITTTVGASYSMTLHAKGGSGNGYVFTVKAGATLPAGLSLSGTGVLSGKPTAAGTFDFEVTVTDSASNTETGDFALTVNAAVTITNPSILPAATVATAYSETLTATGGAGSGYIFTLTSGRNSLTAAGLSLSSAGVLSGTPATTGNAAFSVSVVDSALNYGSGNFTVAMNAAGAGFAINGHIMLANACAAASVPPITLSIDTNPAQTVTSDSSGNYSFANVPGGSYTITPSITGANSIFSPSSMPVTVSGGAVTNQNLVASLAYKVSGTVSYSGAESGQVYIWLLNKDCGPNPLGTSITNPGSFTIEGVPPGSYMLGAGIDSLGFGYQNDVDAAGLASPDVTVFDTDVTGTSITMTDPVQSAPPAGVPVINAITGNASGAVINFQPIVGPHPVFQQIELPTAYVVQWSTDPTFGLVNGSLEFKAGGSNGTGVLLLKDSHLASGNTYYFRMLGTNNFGTGSWSNIYSADGINPTGIMVADPAGNMVSGTVTFDATPTGPLYVGYYDTSTGAVYATRIAGPVSPQPFSMSVPTSQTYFHFAILDQNNDGMIDPGDVSNTRTGNITPAAVTGAMTDQNLDLNTPASTAKVTTHHVKSTNQDGSVVETFQISFDVREGNKLPVSVRVMSGPHVLHPVDVGKCLECGNNQFQYNVSTAANMPAVGDSYTLQVTYDDATTETLTAQIAGVMNDFATNLSPSASNDTSLTPTFSWTAPPDAASYLYQFYLSDNQGNTIWQIPGRNTNSDGFSSQITSLTWGTDPTDANNRPSATRLTQGTTYAWQIRVSDANGNSTETRTYYKP